MLTLWCIRGSSHRMLIGIIYFGVPIGTICLESFDAPHPFVSGGTRAMWGWVVGRGVAGSRSGGR
jgi:hypothetical protein